MFFPNEYFSTSESYLTLCIFLTHLPFIVIMFFVDFLVLGSLVILFSACFLCSIITDAAAVNVKHICYYKANDKTNEK